jgi:hypothetical protein
MPGWGPTWASARHLALHAKGQAAKCSDSTYGMTITVTALCWLSRRIWRYAPLAVIALWWLYGWHVGMTALFVSYGIACFALYEKRVASNSKRG